MSKLRLMIAIAEEDGTVIDRLFIEPCEGQTDLLLGRTFRTIAQLAEDTREYLERRYEVSDK